MIAKLEWTQSIAQQNKEQNPYSMENHFYHINYKMGVTINNGSTTTEPPPYNGQQPTPPEGLNAFLRSAWV